jgi:hypothetical protein
MVLSIIGTAGIGVVWGWLIGLLEGRIFRPQRTIPILFIATFLIFLEILLIEGAVSSVLFWGAMAFSLILHVVWRRKIRRQFDLMTQIPYGG